MYDIFEGLSSDRFWKKENWGIIPWLFSIPRKWKLVKAKLYLLGHNRGHNTITLCYALASASQTFVTKWG